ncbi:MAG: DNA primase small subunit, partial [Candidatus Bathyarchaeota archaeon B23]
ETPCKSEHDLWRCKGCGLEGSGEAPERCPRCGGVSFEEEKWICDRCLDAARHEAQKLLDILIGDFGFSPTEELEVNFTGHRGYHIHVSSPHITRLDQPARREIVDYILGTGLRAELHGFRSTTESTLSEGGWRGRLLRALYDYLETVDLDGLMEVGLRRRTASKMLEMREGLLGALREGRLGRLLTLIRGKNLERLVEAAVGREASAIDTVVTTDLHRLIRLPGTLHGRTGLIAQRVSVEGLDDYDPLVEAVAFKGGMLKVYVERAPRFRIGEAHYGPYGGEEVELPGEAALYLLCKGAARLVG